MTNFEKFIFFLQTTGNKPTSCSLVHILFVLIVICLTVILSYFFRNCKTKTFKIIILIVWLIMVFGEIYKQIISFYYFDNNTLIKDYTWSSFPFQLCSTPLYILPLIIFLKDNKVYRASIAYISTFALFGGIIVMVYPETIFSNYIGINIQTITHHGLQVVSGIFCLTHERKNFNFKYYLKSIYIFLILITIAATANIIVYHVFQTNGITDSFNMFYISPYFEPPTFVSLYNSIPKIVFFLGYTLGFILISFIIYSVFRLIYNHILTNNKDILTNSKDL